jgi:hypothetical protein
MAHDSKGTVGSSFAEQQQRRQHKLCWRLRVRVLLCVVDHAASHDTIRTGHSETNKDAMRGQEALTRDTQLGALFSDLLSQVLAAMPRGGVAFYNCGEHSGRSQPHKHLQVRLNTAGCTAE